MGKYVEAFGGGQSRSRAGPGLAGQARGTTRSMEGVFFAGDTSGMAQQGEITFAPAAKRAEAVLSRLS